MPAPTTRIDIPVFGSGSIFEFSIVLVATASNKTESVTVCFNMPNHCCLLLIFLDILVVSIAEYFGCVDIYTVEVGCSGHKGPDF